MAKMFPVNSHEIIIDTLRHIFVYHDDPQTVVNWYHAIRCCKLHLLQVGFPSEAECELLSHLSQDYIKEGFLHKTGPSPTDVYKRRWCTLGGRKLMYHVEALDAYAKVRDCLVKYYIALFPISG